MTKYLVAAVAVIALALPAAVSAKQSFSQATGGVTLSGPQQLSFNAFDYGATGDRGNVNYRNPSAGVAYKADVYCAAQAGNTSVFAYVIPAGSGIDALTGLRIVWRVADGGSPGAGNDQAGFVNLGTGAPTASDCSAGGFADYAITDGNLVVH